ncbi:hypothetical protein [Streptomyces sp. NRRL F-5727]|uniref:hypothetical protein n=1 Tax=Streptomyces sp. NRRL F-5727 TaxID=1463871 RepID=UPI000690F3C2|nr:hypothetical protein [Streptomyces sp. NRRL F-5727]
MVNRPQAPADPSRGTPRAPRLHGGWLARGAEGRFSVYVPRDGEVVRWTEGAGGRFTGPEALGGGGLLPFLAAAQGPDRYVHLVGLRPTDTGAEAGEDHVELVHSVQFQTGRPNVEWKSIGNANGKAEWYGNPAVAVDAKGRVHVFVRNRGGGVSARVQKDAGGWHPWWDLKGGRTDQNPVAAVNGDGLVELYTATDRGLLRYVQKEPGARPVLEPLLTTPVVQGTLAAVTGDSGHVTLFYANGEGRICAWSPGRGLEPTPFADAVGGGPLNAGRCMIDGYDCTLLAQCDDQGGAALAAYLTEREDTGLHWTPSGPPVLGPPTLTADAEGSAAVAALAADGGVVVTRQKAEPGLALAAWTRL